MSKNRTRGPLKLGAQGRSPSCSRLVRAFLGERKLPQREDLKMLKEKSIFPLALAAVRLTRHGASMNPGASSQLPM
jgi:hypothetical protein